MAARWLPVRPGGFESSMASEQDGAVACVEQAGKPRDGRTVTALSVPMPVTRVRR